MAMLLSSMIALLLGTTELELGVVPVPRRIEPAKGSFMVSELTPILLGNGSADSARFAAMDLVRSLREQGNRTLLVRERKEEAGEGAILAGDPDKDPALRARAERLGLRLENVMEAEGYALGIDPAGVVLVARTPAGLLHGFMTLRQMLLGRFQNAPLPAARIHDWPALKLRGIHDEISYGQVSTMENFQDLIRFCALHKMNAMMIYLEDMFRFSKYPTIGVGRGALTREQVDALEAFARPYHVEIIPVFETLGNQGALLMLDEVRPYAEYPGAHSFAVDEDTYRFLAPCLDELTAAFDSKYFNAGLDESWDLGFGKTRERVRREGRGPVHAAHYRKINDMLKARGKTMMMYADIILHRPTILSLIPKDIILVDWHYEAAEHFSSVPRLAKAGFPLVVLPGLSNWDRIFPTQATAMINIKNFTKDGVAHGALGSITSTWGDNGSKNLRELNYPGYAYTAQVAWNPDETDVADFYDRFFSLWNGPGTATDLRAIYSLLEKWPWWYPLLDYFREPFLPRKDNRAHTEEELYRVAEDARVARALVEQLRGKITRRAGDLDYLDYCARMHENYVDAQRLVRDLNRFPADRASDQEKRAAQAAFRTRIDQVRREVVGLRDQYRELWLRTNLPANLHYCIDEYDRLIHCWDMARSRVDAGQFAYDPRPPAHWIYHPNGVKTPVPTAHFRKTFQADPKKVQRAHIEVQGDTHVHIAVNGKEIGEQFVRRNLSAPVNPLLVRVYDLAPHLVPGTNVLTIIAREYGTENSDLEPSGPRSCGGFFLYGEIATSERGVERILSDRSWKVSDKAAKGWMTPSFTDSSWPSAYEEPSPTVWVTYPDFTKNWPGYSARR